MVAGVGRQEVTDHQRIVATGLAIERVRAELMRAVAKYPPFASPHEGYAILLEEVDELWDEIKANNHGRAIDEALQVAAMAVRFVTDIEAKLRP